MFVKVVPLDYRRILLQHDPAAAARPDPVVMDRWWQERYPGHLRTAHAYPEHQPFIPLEVTRG
jgi:hypothetical protein